MRAAMIATTLILLFGFAHGSPASAQTVAKICIVYDSQSRRVFSFPVSADYTTQLCNDLAAANHGRKYNVGCMTGNHILAGGAAAPVGGSAVPRNNWIGTADPTVLSQCSAAWGY